MLNVKQESCKYQLFQFFGLTQRENQMQIYNYEMDATTISFHTGLLDS